MKVSIILLSKRQYLMSHEAVHIRIKPHFEFKNKYVREESWCSDTLTSQ